ncbi:hypothetical protein TNCV_4107431 [Trichonephila clavipes]|nr:hypothetical protein TNCV_4107431 [Trichonephila clavipes]
MSESSDEADVENDPYYLLAPLGSSQQAAEDRLNLHYQNYCNIIRNVLLQFLMATKFVANASDMRVLQKMQLHTDRSGDPGGHLGPRQN